MSTQSAGATPLWRETTWISETQKPEHLANLNILMQIGLVVFTALGFLFTSIKLPHYGVAANLVGQIFWLYSSYRAWREADQIGVFITTICITLILLYGVANYWL